MSESDKKYIRESRLSVIDRDNIGVLLYAKIRAQRSPAWAIIYDEILNLNVSVGGRGRRDVIKKMEALMRERK